MIVGKLQQFKPIELSRSGWGLAKIAHLTARILLPFLLLILVRIDIIALAFALVVLAKWRMLAVRPRFWLANIRGNAVDIIVGLSTVVFVIQSSSLAWQIAWVVLFAVWQVSVKPSDKTWAVGLQAYIGEICGLVAAWLAWGSAPVFVLALVSGLVCYLSARHFFDAFEEVYAKLLSYLWAVFAAATTWLLGHLLFFYGPVNQPTLLLAAVSFGGATLYYLDHFDRNSKLARRQIILLILIVIGVILAKLVPLMFYVWSDSVL